MPLGLLLDIRPAQPQVVQGRITEAGQFLALAVQLQPTRRALQGGMPQVVQGKGRLLDAADMTFHREALRVDGLSFNPGIRSIQRMFLMPSISEIDAMSQYQSLDADVLRTFVAIAEQGGFTRAGEVVNRTQSAVSMQMKRLEEDILQRQLFERDGRQVRLTAEGQVLLGYARRILKLHGEVFNTLRMPHMVGVVRIGTPDDYAMRFLPTILSSFAQAYPLVQVEVHCDSSKQLMLRQDLDLTIVTREPGNEIGQLLRQERLVWAAAEGFCPQEQRPMPVALFNTDCFCRAWTCNALEAQGIDYRIAYTSPSLAAIFAIVTAGLAVTAQLQSLIGGNIRILGESEGLPQLPVANVMLVRSTQNPSPITDCMADYIVEGFK